MKGKHFDADINLNDLINDDSVKKVNMEDYEIQPSRPSAIGGYSNTYEAIEKATMKRHVAKILRDNSDEGQTKNFINQIHIMSKLNFPSVIKFIGYGVTKRSRSPKHVMLLESAAKYTLSNTIDQDRHGLAPADFNDTKKHIILYGIASGMAYVHSLGYLHCNLRPENIFLDENFFPKICDFSFSEEVTISFSKVIVDSVLYIAPEVIEEEQYVKASDVYSFSMIMYELLTKQVPFENKTASQFMQMIMSGKRPEIPEHLPDIYKNLIERCWAQDPDDRHSFEEIKTILQTNIAYLNIDNDEFNNYCDILNIHESREKAKSKQPNILSKSDEQELPQDASSSQIECSVCLKKFNEKEVICVEGDVFMCREDFDSFERMNELPQNFVDCYCDKIIDETFSPFVSSTSVDSCRKEDIFIDSEMLSDSLHLNEDFKYFCPTVTFHFERSPSEIDFKKIIEILPDCMSVTHIRKGSTFIVIAFIAAEEAQATDKGIRKMIEKIKAKLNPPMKEPIVGNFGEPTFEVPDDNDIKEFFQKKSVNIFQNPEILSLINCRRVQKKVNEKLKKQKIEDKNLGFIFDHFDMFESSEEQVRKDIEKSEYEFIVTGETIIANRFFNEYEEIKNTILKEGSESSECFLYHGSQLKNHFGIVGEHFNEPKVDEYIDDDIGGLKDRGYYGIGIYATDDIFYASMYSNNRYMLKYNRMASIICCRAIYNKNKVLEIKPIEKKWQNPLPYFGKEMSPEIANNYGIHKVLVGSSTRYRPIHEKNIQKNLIAAYEYVFSDSHQIIPISSFTIKRTDHFMIWIDDGPEDNHEILDEIRKTVEVNIYLKSSVSECIELIKKKKRNAVKIIVSVSKKETEEEIINATNDIKEIKCIFMIYSKGRSLTELPGDRKNVLYTNKSSHIIKFGKCGMKIEKITKLAKKLRKKYNIQMSIDLEKMSDPLEKLTYPF